jgi:TPR repeat protein
VYIYIYIYIYSTRTCDTSNGIEKWPFCLLSEFIVTQDDVILSKHMQKLAKMGKPWCQCSLVVAYLCEDYSLKRNYEQAIHWLRRAADQGLRQAHFELAKCYRDGLSVQQPHSQVFHHGA